MPQIQCFCDFAQCGGAMVDLQTFQRHKRHDSSKSVRDALAKATLTCNNQDDHISTYLESLSLSPDNPSVRSHRPPPVKSSGKPTERKRIEELLYQLRDIETSLDTLANSVNGKLGCVGYPRTANDVFPLLSSISTARTVQTQLSHITSRAASVQETKSSLLVRLGQVVTKLKDAKCAWNKHAEGLPSQKDFETTFSAGKSSF